MSKKIMTSKKGRKCKHKGCKHILSIYNHDDYCNTHADDKQKKMIPKKSKAIQ